MISQTIPLLATVASGGFFTFLTAFFAAFLILFLFLLLAVYVYTSFAYMSIAKRTKSMALGIAWIPIAGPLLIAAKIAKMHWWPILLLLGIFIPFAGLAAIIVFAVFFYIWKWKLFEKLGRPGWWSLLSLISGVRAVLLGIAAWGKPRKRK